MSGVDTGIDTPEKSLCRLRPGVNLGTEIQDPELKQALGISDGDTIVAPIALGYPEKIPAAPKRKEPDILAIVN